MHAGQRLPPADGLAGKASSIQEPITQVVHPCRAVDLHPQCIPVASLSSERMYPDTQCNLRVKPTIRITQPFSGFLPMSHFFMFPHHVSHLLSCVTLTISNDQTFYGHTNAVNHVCCSLRGDMVSTIPLVYGVNTKRSRQILESEVLNR